MILSTPGQWLLGWQEDGFLGLLEALGIPLWAFIVTIVTILGALAVSFLVPFPQVNRPT